MLGIYGLVMRGILGRDSGVIVEGGVQNAQNRRVAIIVLGVLCIGIVLRGVN